MAHAHSADYDAIAMASSDMMRREKSVSSALRAMASEASAIAGQRQQMRYGAACSRHAAAVCLLRRRSFFRFHFSLLSLIFHRPISPS